MGAEFAEFSRDSVFEVGHGCVRTNGRHPRPAPRDSRLITSAWA